MTKMFVSPQKYIQGEGVLSELNNYVGHLGNKVLIVASSSALLAKWSTVLKQGLSGKEIIIEEFGGKECSKEQIGRLVSKSKEEKIDFVMGFGGGKAQDVAKAISHKLDYIPLVIAPSIASCDAPTSALSVVYTEQGSFEEIWFYKQNPYIVIIDTKVIANAPARYLVAGMGDALATKFEADACVQSGGKAINGGYATELARAIADLSYELLLKYGVQAKKSVENQVVTPALEKVVETNSLLSGLGFENNGVASAHGIHDGLTVLPEVKKFLHGEKLGFCTMCLLVLEGKPPSLLNEVINFCYDVGLPITLGELGIKEDVPAKIKKVSEAVNFDLARNHSFEVTSETLYDAIILADSLGSEFIYERSR